MAGTKVINKVIVVGAGPAGLLMGLLLARQNIEVLLLDAGTKPDENPRAAHYAPSAAYDLDRAGVLGDVMTEGFCPTGVSWREPDGKFVAGIKAPKEMEYPMVCLPLSRLVQLLYTHLKAQPTAEVKWGHRVTSLDQDSQEARVIVETPQGKETFGADYVIGCDGANSQVRRSLFGDREFPGETLPYQIIATNVRYDFHKFGYWDSNFILHKEDWYMAAKITKDGLWRVTYGDVYGLTTEEYLARQPDRYAKLLPGNPKPGDYELVSASPYKLQQRCARSFRVGRILLAADAAHICNPFGGLGLTGGIADVGSLYDCFMAMQKGLVDDKILDKYDEVRRRIYRDLIDPMSRANFRRLWAEDAAQDRLEFFDMCRKADGNAELELQMAKYSHALREDFSEYINSQRSEAQSVSASG